MALTQSWLKAQHRKVRTKEFVIADRDGLSARVSPKGKITFYHAILLWRNSQAPRHRFMPITDTKRSKSRSGSDTAQETA